MFHTALHYLIAFSNWSYHRMSLREYQTSPQFDWTLNIMYIMYYVKDTQWYKDLKTFLIIISGPLNSRKYNSREKNRSKWMSQSSMRVVFHTSARPQHGADTTQEQHHHYPPPHCYPPPLPSPPVWVIFFLAPSRAGEELDSSSRLWPAGGREFFCF